MGNSCAKSNQNINFQQKSNTITNIQSKQSFLIEKKNQDQQNLKIFQDFPSNYNLQNYNHKQHSFTVRKSKINFQNLNVILPSKKQPNCLYKQNSQVDISKKPLSEIQINKIQQEFKQNSIPEITSQTIFKNTNQNKNVTNYQIKRDNFIKMKTQNIYDSYSLKKKIGEGSYGCVYKAVCKKTKQVRAIKVIKNSSIIDQKGFFAEFEILRVLDHPNIVKLYEIIQFHGNYYIITQFCQGGEIINQVKKLKGLSQSQAAKIMKQILLAVNYMHKNNIVHRDLKLDNILYEFKNKNQSQSNIKIIDFGTSKFIKKSHILTSFIGTPLYIAPEVLRSSYSEKCDIWSCGIIMYILLCGKPPFTGQSQANIFQKIKYTNLSFDDQKWSKISISAKNMILSMLEKNAVKRPSAQQLLYNSWLRINPDIQVVQKELLINLQDFYFKDKLRAVLLTYLASNTITQTRRRELAHKFQQIDKNNQGVISKQELMIAYKEIYNNIPQEEIESIIHTIDTDKSGCIDFTEFIVACQSEENLFYKQSLEKAFRFFDKNNSGYLDLNELKQMLNQTDDIEVQKIIRGLRLNQPNKISRDQFIANLLPKPLIT